MKINHITNKYINSSYLSKRAKEYWIDYNSKIPSKSYDKYISEDDIMYINELSDIIMDECVVNIEDIDKSYLKN